MPRSRDSSDRRRVAVVRAGGESGAAPPGVDPAEFARACLADSYEVVAELAGVRSGIAGDDGPTIAGLLWPGAVHWPGRSILELAGLAAAEHDELVVVAPDVPDLPDLILAKVFQGLHRSAVCIAPERADDDEPAGCVAVGLRLPWPDWLPGDLGLDTPVEVVRSAAPDRRALLLGPPWHRLRRPAAVHRLDPGLEGWEHTRALLEGRPLRD
ncbi:hypothetical protein [Microlunatus speluncae]|uniref:hypothetical protein n=1 Tax=Microlunatus speluncae TaxID=2594267 RepID=UPI0012662DBC|nr:hypothetical protein [Microlunatus speluncae]